MRISRRWYCDKLRAMTDTTTDLALANGALDVIDDRGVLTSPRPDVDRDKLKRMTTTIGFDDIRATAETIAAGKVRGRVVVDIG